MTFASAVLAQDSDLTKYESSMPALATKMGVLSGKRELAKDYLRRFLTRRGIDVDTIADFTVLNPAATFKELELIYRNLSEKPESIATVKAGHYRAQFDAEMELLILTLSDGGTASTSLAFIPAYRA